MNGHSLDHGQSAKMPSTLLSDFVTNTIYKLGPSPSSLFTCHSSGTPYSITHYVNYHNFSMHHRHFLASVSAGIEPQSFAETMKDE